MNFSLVIHNLSWCQALILVQQISSNNFLFNQYHGGSCLWCSMLHISSYVGMACTWRGVLNGFMRHLFQSQPKRTGVVSGITMAWSNSTTQTLGDIINAYFIAVRRTCWIHDNVPRTLQGIVAQNGWLWKIGKRSARTRNKTMDEKKGGKGKFFNAYLWSRVLKNKKQSKEQGSMLIRNAELKFCKHHVS